MNFDFVLLKGKVIFFEEGIAMVYYTFKYEMI